MSALILAASFHDYRKYLHSSLPALQVALNPCAFIARCHGSASIQDVAWRSGICGGLIGGCDSSISLADHRSLMIDVMHHIIFSAVGGEPFEALFGQTIQPFGGTLFSQVMLFMQTQDVRAISLLQLTREPLYNTANIALLGSSFPLDTYNDFNTLDKSAPYRFGGLPFWSWPSTCARERLVAHFADYLQRGDIAARDSPFASEFMEIFKANNIQNLDGARMALTFMWSVHSNPMNIAFWMVIFLLADQDAFARVRAEIDSAVEGKFANLKALLEADPDELDEPCFALLTSSIMETMRLTAINIDGDRTIPIRKGEFIWGNIRAVHTDEAVYPDGHKFVVDRFADRPYRKGQLQTDGKPFFSLGGGRHLCKGRWFAIYELKVMAIILFRLFDITPLVEKSSEWHLPRVHRRSIGSIHTQDNVLVQLRPRQLGNALSHGLEGRA
ncbi:cytochrome P450 [Melanogaster broomeanus]|nr:cytochrome P450 [Melanogaster broomeanus]